MTLGIASILALVVSAAEPVPESQLIAENRAAQAALAVRKPRWFVEGISFRDGFTELSKHWNVKIHVDWPTLIEAGLDDLQIVRVRAFDTTLNTAIEMLLTESERLDRDDQLVATIHEGRIVVTTRREVRRLRRPVAFDLQPLLASVSDAAARAECEATLRSLVRSRCDPSADEPRSVGSTLVVSCDPLERQVISADLAALQAPPPPAKNPVDALLDAKLPAMKFEHRQFYRAYEDIAEKGKVNLRPHWETVRVRGICMSIPISDKFEGSTVRDALRKVLERTEEDGERVDFAVVGDRVVVNLHSRLLEQWEWVQYALPADARTPDGLARLRRSIVALDPYGFTEADGAVWSWPDRLLVRQVPLVHERIRTLLGNR